MWWQFFKTGDKLKCFSFCWNRQRHTGYQEIKNKSEWWAAHVSFLQASARIIRKSTSLSVTDCHSGHDVHSHQCYIAALYIPLSHLFPARNRKSLVLSSTLRVPGIYCRRKDGGLSLDWGRRCPSVLQGLWAHSGPGGVVAVVPKGKFPNVSFYELLGSIKLPYKAVVRYCLLLLDRYYY